MPDIEITKAAILQEREGAEWCSICWGDERGEDEADEDVAFVQQASKVSAAPAAAPAQAPPPTAAEGDDECDFEGELTLLRGMGFEELDAGLLHDLLLRSGGDVHAVVEMFIE